MKTVYIQQTLILSSEVEVTDDEMKILKSDEPQDQEPKAKLQEKLCGIADDHRREKKQFAEWESTTFLDENEELFDVG